MIKRRAIPKKLDKRFMKNVAKGAHIADAHWNIRICR